MSQNRFYFDGLEELREELRNLPLHLTREAAGIVEFFAEDAARTIRAAYPFVTGNLRDHVIVESASTAFAIVAVVKNTAKHARIFENGTQARHYVTRNGIKHLTGAMPAGHVFVPIVIRKRVQMYEALKELIREQGMEVVDDAAA